MYKEVGVQGVWGYSVPYSVPIPAVPRGKLGSYPPGGGWNLPRPLDCYTNPSVVAVGLSVSYGTWPPVDWSKYRLGNTSNPLNSRWSARHYGWRDQWEFLSFFKGHWQPLGTALTTGKLPTVLPLGLCKETERVYPPTHAAATRTGVSRNML